MREPSPLKNKGIVMRGKGFVRYADYEIKDAMEYFKQRLPKVYLENKNTRECIIKIEQLLHEAFDD